MWEIILVFTAILSSYRSDRKRHLGEELTKKMNILKFYPKISLNNHGNNPPLKPLLSSKAYKCLFMKFIIIQKAPIMEWLY